MYDYGVTSKSPITVPGCVARSGNDRFTNCYNESLVARTVCLSSSSIAGTYVSIKFISIL